jgi:ABC-type sugar transport system ATPase subunit
MSVAENVAFGLRVRPRASRPPRAEIARRVRALLERMQIAELADRLPEQISGGQRQRVALARALAIEPRLLLLDEPFGALDAEVRKGLRRWLRALHAELGLTSLFVTHDQDEAMELADRVAVMQAGQVAQFDTPAAILDRPANAFVAGFIGSPAMNLVTGDAVDGGVRVGTTVLPVPRAQLDRAAGGTGRATVGFRPESLVVGAAGDGLPVAVTLVEQLGSDAYVHGTCGDDAVVLRTASREAPAVGDTVWVAPRADALHVFDPTTGTRVA